METVINDDTRALRPGSRLEGGKYTIEKTLGEGGFGITYLASHTWLNKQVAVKEFFMRQLCWRDATTSEVAVGSTGSRETVRMMRRKFVKEAQTIAALDDERVIRIHDIFEENGTAYYVMEYIAGGSLADLVRSKIRQDKGKATRKRPENIQKATRKHPENVQEIILDILRSSPAAGRKTLSMLTGETEGRIKYQLKVLQDKGVLKRRGPAKGGHWEIVQDERFKTKKQD